MEGTTKVFLNMTDENAKIEINDANSTTPSSNNIVYRKKSPFPKTYDPNYLNLVEREVLNLLDNNTLKIHQILNKQYVLEIINTHGKNLKENLFGQLMTYPQTLAYIYQISMWLELYDIEIDI